MKNVFRNIRTSTVSKLQFARSTDCFHPSVVSAVFISSSFTSFILFIVSVSFLRLIVLLRFNGVGLDDLLRLVSSLISLDMSSGILQDGTPQDGCARCSVSSRLDGVPIG